MKLLEKQINEMIKWKNEIPVLKNLSFNTMSNVLMFIVYTYIIIVSFESIVAIKNLIIFHKQAPNLIWLIIYNLLIITSTIITLLTKNNLKLIIFILLIIGIYN